MEPPNDTLASRAVRRPIVSQVPVGDHTRFMLSIAHHNNALMPIVGPDFDGVFPDAGRRDPLPVVVDANWLRSDVLYAVTNDQRTAMVTTANVGMIRLYAAPHVIAEVDEHHVDWCVAKGVAPAVFLARWVDEYLPLMRVVEPPDGLLTATEQRRIDRLGEVDPDDVESAVLAVVLEAFFLSRDRAARRAVYGEQDDGCDDQALREWLFTSGDAFELADLTEMFGTVAGGAVGGAFHAGRTLWRRDPALLVLLLALGAVGLALLPRERLRQLGDTVVGGVKGYSDLLVLRGRWRSELRAGLPVVPRWAESTDVSSPAVLTRACVHALARAQSSHYSASELTGLLPDLRVAQGEGAVRATLREHSCFREVRRGRFQLGARAPRVTVRDVSLKPDVYGWE
jgi:predicted nucleic acid-binding protein